MNGPSRSGDGQRDPDGQVGDRRCPSSFHNGPRLENRRTPTPHRPLKQSEERLSPKTVITTPVGATLVVRGNSTAYIP
jgi:hypothetical protein